MANDKDFILKNAVEVGGPTNVTLGTITGNAVNLSTGNYFKDTPSGTSTYSISNAGDVQSFQLEVTGGLEAVASSFSTDLYTGNSGTQTITNGIDLSSDGGLVWFKNRTSANTNHSIFDSESGATGGTRLRPNLTNGLQTFNGTAVFTTSSTGFALNNDASNDLNDNSYNYVAWTFKKQAKFLDIVTYTGDGTTGRQISHNLGGEVGTLIIKKTNATGSWIVYHRSLGTSQYMALESTSQALNFSAVNTVTSTYFVSDNQNASGSTYVAYLFAHDTAADSIINCGSYTGSGAEDNKVTIGFEPQWLMVKNASTSATDWVILDTIRGMNSSSSKQLRANLSNAEFDGGSNYAVDLHADGFSMNGNNTNTNGTSGNTFVYIAIRAASDLDITWPSSIEWAGGVAPAAPATGETDIFTFSTDDGGTSYIGTKTADNLS